MPSRALVRWNRDGSARLDEIQGAHATVGGTKPGRRRATEQINHAYVVLLAATFQRFCRDLHTESVNAIVGALKPKPALETVLLAMATRGRQLDFKNATRATIAADFAPVGLKVLDDLKALDARNAKRLAGLDQLNDWRNAIAHQDFAKKILVPATIHLKNVRTWRAQCALLANAMDRVMATHLYTLVGAQPW